MEHMVPYSPLTVPTLCHSHLTGMRYLGTATPSITMSVVVTIAVPGAISGICGLGIAKRYIRTLQRLQSLQRALQANVRFVGSLRAGSIVPGRAGLRRIAQGPQVPKGTLWKFQKNGSELYRHGQ